MNKDMYIQQVRQHLNVTESTAAAILAILHATNSTVALRELKEEWEDRHPQSK